MFWTPNFWIFRPPDFQTPPPDELSDPNLTPLPTHPGIKYVARALAATNPDLADTLGKMDLNFKNFHFF